MIHRPALLAVMIAVLLGAGCGPGSSGEESVFSAGGPLVLPVDGEVGVSVYPPQGVREDWSATFSGLPLCTAVSAPARLLGVDVTDQEGDVAGLEVFVATPASRRATVLTSALGKAPEFAESYAEEGWQWSAEWDVSPVADGVIPSCDVPLSEQPHLVFTFATGDGGGVIREWVVRYESEQRAYASESIHYAMALCGAAGSQQLDGSEGLC